MTMYVSIRGAKGRFKHAAKVTALEFAVKFAIIVVATALVAAGTF